MAEQQKSMIVRGAELPPLVAARENARLARQRLQERVHEAMHGGDPAERLARVIELYRLNALETSTVVQDAVLEVFEKGSVGHVHQGETLDGGLTTGDLRDLEAILKSCQERSLLMMGLPTKITASHQSVSGEMTYRGQKTQPAKPGDELSDDELAPTVEGEVVA
jgi:hypothetical protein